MFRALIDLLLLALAAVLAVAGVLTYPAIHGGVLAGILAVAVLLLVPAGRRTAGAVA